MVSLMPIWLCGLNTHIQFYTILLQIYTTHKNICSVCRDDSRLRKEIANNLLVSIWHYLLLFVYLARASLHMHTCSRCIIYQVDLNNETIFEHKQLKMYYQYRYWVLSTLRFMKLVYFVIHSLSLRFKVSFLRLPKIYPLLPYSKIKPNVM